MRLTEAARLLTGNPAATASEVADSVSYGNVSYFKEEYDCTPKVFKNVALRRDTPSDSDTAGRQIRCEDAADARQNLHDS